MRLKVRGSWRTRLLVLFAIAVAGALTLFGHHERDARRPHASPSAPRRPAPDVVEVELTE